jgi:putative CocE/NonD family hydrolase
METRQPSDTVLENVRRIDHVPVTMPDGVVLGARMWLPADTQAHPVPAILESHPYRKSDGTAVRDSALAPWFAEHGYAFVRLDIRGSGDSEGILEDEYLPQEQQDNAATIAWLAEQEWCNGQVGMIGISWSGFSALQAAALAPPELGGVIVLHCSDDRYTDDVHYIGGCVSAIDMLQWASSMRAYLAQPPDPEVADDWREQWLERLERTPPFIEPWLSHQRRDAYWRQGSVNEDYSAVKCPVFAVGGWCDGYRDSVLRLVEHLPGPARGLIGPWAHTWPQTGEPGPSIGFLQECARFFDCTLKGVGNGFLEEPRLVTWMQDAVSPAPGYDVRPGRWVAEPSWPSPNVSIWALPLGEAGLGEGQPEARTIRSLQSTGVEAGVWCADEGAADSPLDQRPDDGCSLCYDGEPLAEPLELLGHAAAVLEISVDRPLALIAVRLCDVAPDGASALIARGVLNLTRRDGLERTDPMPAEAMAVRVPMQSTSYAVPAGHRLRVAISPTYWPWVWPSPEPVILSVLSGGLELPVRRLSELDSSLRRFDEPVSSPEVETQQSGGVRARRVRRDLAAGSVEVEFDWQGDSRTLIAESGTEMGERNVTYYRIAEGDPLSAQVQCEVDVTLRRGDWNVRAEVRSSMSCDHDSFTVATDLRAYEDEQEVFARADSHTIARDGG